MVGSIVVIDDASTHAFDNYSIGMDKVTRRYGGGRETKWVKRTAVVKQGKTDYSEQTSKGTDTTVYISRILFPYISSWFSYYATLKTFAWHLCLVIRHWPWAAGVCIT